MFLTIADVIQLKSIIRPVCNLTNVKYSSLRRSATSCANEFSYTKNYQTILVFQMVHGTNGVHVVRIVRGTNSQRYE